MTGNMTHPLATFTRTGGQRPRRDSVPALSSRDIASSGYALRKRAMTSAALLFVGAGIALGATACGGSTSAVPTATTAANNQAFIAKVNSACDQDNLRQNVVGSPPKITPSNPTAQDLVAAATYLDKERTVLRALLTDLDHLGKPPQNRPTFDEALANLRKAADDAQSADQAAKAADTNSFKTRLTSYKSDLAQADNLGQSLGFTHCRRSQSGGSLSNTSGGPLTNS